MLETYITRFDIFCSVTDVPADKKAFTLLNAMGSKTFNLLLNVAAPKKPNELQYADIVELLTKHFDPAPLIIAERFKFHKRDQRRGESISEYL